MDLRGEPLVASVEGVRGGGHRTGGRPGQGYEHFKNENRLGKERKQPTQRSFVFKWAQPGLFFVYFRCFHKHKFGDK